MGNPKPTPNPQSPASLGNQPASHTNPSHPPTWICREDSDPDRQGIQLGLLLYGNFIYVDPNKNITIETGYRLSQYRSRPNPLHTVTLSNLKKKKLVTGSFSGIYVLHCSTVRRTPRSQNSIHGRKKNKNNDF